MVLPLKFFFARPTIEFEVTKALFFENSLKLYCIMLIFEVLPRQDFLRQVCRLTVILQAKNASCCGITKGTMLGVDVEKRSIVLGGSVLSLSITGSILMFN